MGRIESFSFLSNLVAGSHLPPAANSTLSPRETSWTQDDVVALMDRLYPPPSGKPGDQSLMRQQLSSAFLAGVAKSQEELLLKPSQSLVQAALLQARVLLKNRAATQDNRLWDAFMAGARAARATAELGYAHAQPPVQCEADTALQLFIRQPFTESGETQQALVASVLDQIDACNGQPHAFDYLTGRQAENAQTFKRSFEAETGQAFTPQAFRAHRLGLLSRAEAFVNIRVGMSESSAFELSYHVFRGACTPVLFLVWKHAPIKTTLLKDLGNLCDVTYLEFEQADDLREGMVDFFHRIRCSRRKAA
jgi:hypothetical protein